MPGKLSIVLALCLAAHGQTRVIAPGAGTRIELTVEKTGLMSGKKHTLVWERFSGQYSNTAVSLQIEASSLKVLDDWIGDSKKEDVRKEALGKDVLDTAKFPSLAFVSTAVTGDVNGAFQIAGMLTVRGIAKPVTLAAKKAADGSYSAEGSFAMSAFGIKPPKAALGAVGTKDLMTLRVTVNTAR